MAITTRLSEIEAGVEQANGCRTAASAHRYPAGDDPRRHHLGPAQPQRDRRGVSESGSILSGSIAFLIRAVAALLPVGAGPGRGLVRAWWRRRRRAPPPPAEVTADAGSGVSPRRSRTRRTHQLQRQFLHRVAHLLRGALPTSTSSSWMPGPMSSDSPAELESSSSMCGIRSSVSSTCSMPSRPSSRSLMARASSSVPVMRSRSMAMA